MIREFSIPGEHFIWCGDLSADGKILATSESNGVMLWDTATGQRRVGKGQPTSRRENHMIKSLRIAPDGKSVATLGGDWVRFWDVATAEETRRIALPNKGPLDGFSWTAPGSCIRPDGTNAGSDERARRPDLPARRRLGPRAGPPRRASNKFKALAFSPDGKILATGIDTGKRVASARAGDPALGRGRAEGTGPRPCAPVVHPGPGVLPRRPPARLGERGRHGLGLGRGQDHRPQNRGRIRARLRLK